jgi:HdeA/HdeB family
LEQFLAAQEWAPLLVEGLGRLAGRLVNHRHLSKSTLTLSLIVWLAASRQYSDFRLRSSKMTLTCNKVMFVVIVFAVMLTSVTCFAQDKSGERTVEQFACKDVMRESGLDRDVAIAFLHGFLVGKSGNSKFNIDLLRKQSDLFIDRCLENPNEKALDAMLKVKG